METNAMNPFEQYTATERQPQNINKLAPGQYLVTIEDRITFTTDKITVGTEGDENVELTRDWQDENPVLYLYLTCEQGVYHHRFYWYGYTLWEELVKMPSMKDKLGEFRCTQIARVRPYAIHTASNSRLVDDKKTAYCKQLLDQWMTTVGCANKSPKEMIGKKIWIEVVEQVAFGRKHSKILRIAPEEVGFNQLPKAGFAMPKGTDVKPLF